MSKQLRKMFAEMIRARKAGRTGLIGGDIDDVRAWALRCSLDGPMGRLP